jgi:hypothetical protein
VSYRPSEGLEKDPAIAGSVVRICARAASIGEEEVSQWCPAVKHSGSGSGEDRWCFPSLATHSLESEYGLYVGTVVVVNLVP